MLGAAKRFADGLVIRVGSRVPTVARIRTARRARRVAQSVEPELRLLEFLVRDHVFIDVGANAGIYSAYALRHGAREVVAVEPVPELANTLRALLRGRGQVLEAAASVAAGFSVLRIPSVAGVPKLTRSTLEPGSTNVIEVRVETIRVDQIAFDGKAVMKVDVEGHELDALRGATGILGARRVEALIIESEERHSAGGPRAVIDFLEHFDYTGWLVVGTTLVPADRFDPLVHQTSDDVAQIESGEPPSTSYGNNFVFVPELARDRFTANAQRTGFRVST